jgi:hypothetical protein
MRVQSGGTAAALDQAELTDGARELALGKLAWRCEGSHGVAAAVWRHRRAGRGLYRRGILRAELAGAAVDLRGRLQRAQPCHGLWEEPLVVFHCSEKKADYAVHQELFVKPSCQGPPLAHVIVFT